MSEAKRGSRHKVIAHAHQLGCSCRDVGYLRWGPRDGLLIDIPRTSAALVVTDKDYFPAAGIWARYGLTPLKTRAFPGVPVYQFEGFV